jgi:hypothetical protein
MGFVALAPGLAGAQPVFDLSLGSSLQSLSSTSLGARETQSSFAGGGTLGFDFLAARGYAGYGLESGAYASPGDWSYRLHRFDSRYRLDLSPTTKLHAGAAVALRRNGTAWQEVDYDAVGGFVNLEKRTGAGLTLRAGYRIDRRTFDALAPLDQTEHGLFASLLANLPSRTTLIAEARAGVKGYRGEPFETRTADPVPEARAQADTSAPQGQGSGRGAGGPGDGGMGPSSRPALPGLSPATGNRARQLTLLARVAQSLGERTGLSLQATWRGTGGSVPPAVVTTPAGFFDDGVYDDPFASDLAAVQLRLKHLRPGGAVLQAGARRFVQSYAAAVALGADGLPLPAGALREDRVWRADVSAELPLLRSRTGAFDVALELGYAYTLSRSNDAFYDYRNHAGGVALSLAY